MLRRSAWYSLLVSLALAISVSAQVDTATVAGTIRDTSGGVLPGVKVSIVSDATGQRFEVETNSTGIYVSPPLRAGEYVITAAAEGFERSARRAQLDVSQ